MISVILVSPEGEVNVGSAARAMRNFGVEELILVSPRCKIGFETRLFAKHAFGLVEKARRAMTLDEAIKGFDLIVGTSGVARRYSDRLKNSVTPRQLAQMISQIPAKKVAVVFGSESTGLAEEQLLKCDIVATIPASKEYPVLNLSHAVAVVLYELYAAGVAKERRSRLEKGVFQRPASREKRALLESVFSHLAQSMSSIKNPQKVSQAFRNVVERSRPSDEEVQAMMAAFGPLGRMARKKA
ncbi:TrmJ/YjtD family RNA methyltransferase [Candidatus Micrarchaeota archaeon]|nr:TrmJ/YjtD family RNA methyltransferase [Candidatus Micrarchaeota archaeon]